MALFRIAQEAIANVREHSGSPRTIIRLERDGGTVRLEIEDAGHGFPPGLLDENGGPCAPHGVGILGMRERAEQRGGRLTISSSGSGSTVLATLPLSLPQIPPNGKSVRP